MAGVVPSATFLTKDGRSVVIGGNGDSIYTRLMAAVGRPDMGSQNPTYATNALRCQRQDEIYQVRPHLGNQHAALPASGRGLPGADVVVICPHLWASQDGFRVCGVACLLCGSVDNVF